MALPETMKALVAYDRGGIIVLRPAGRFRNAETMISSSGQRVRDLCGGSEVLSWEFHLGDETHERWVRPPFIPGHEFLGHVVAKGKNVTARKIGDRVIADQIVPCGQCRFCRTGRYWMCQPHATFGFQKENNGGMAEYVRYPKNAVIHRVPDDMPLEQALLIELYSCSKHAVDRADIGPEDIMVISGRGTWALE